MLNVCANQFAGQLTLVNETNAGSTNLKKVEAEATNQTTSTEEAKKLTATVLEFSKAKETSSTKENGFFDAIGRFFKKVWTGIKETAKKVQIPFSEKELQDVFSDNDYSNDFEGIRNQLIIELFYYLVEMYDCVFL
jgi:hypothetical protein